jgi:microcystin-dependent protein
MVQQTINLYAWRENEKMIPPVLITQGESDTRTATFRLLDQATTIDLTGKSISFEYDKPDGFHVSLICQPTENPGECTCTFSDQAAIAPGIVNDTRVMVRSGTDVLEIVGPRLYIAVGINASAIVSSSEFATLSAYMSDLSTYYQQVAAVQAGLTQTNENVSSLDSELTALQGTVTGNKSELDGKIASLQSSLTAHTGNNTIHVTQADKNKWNENSITAGSVWLWPGNTPPAGWLLCNGQAVSRATYANLFSVLGTAYGQGNGSTTFNVPDLTGRVPVGANSTYPLAGKGGEAAHALTSAENGPHTHDRLLWVDGQPVTLTGSELGAYRVSFTYDKGGPNMVSTSESGQGQAHNNMQPYIAQHYIIKY